MAHSPPLVIPGVVQAKIGTEISGRGAFNVIHFRKIGGITVTQALTDLIGAAIKAAWAANIAGRASTNTGLIRVALRDLSTPNQTEYIDTGAPTLGTGVGTEPLPAGAALCITLRTLKSGKSFRGRFYLGGYAESENDASGQPTQAAADAATAYLDQIRTSCRAQGLELCVASRPAYDTTVNKTTVYADGTTEVERLWHSPARIAQATDVSDVQVRDLNWDSMRKRNVGGGVSSGGFMSVASRR